MIQDILKKFIDSTDKDKKKKILNHVLPFRGNQRHYTAYIFMQKEQSALQTEINTPYYLMVKKKWLYYDYWMPRDIKKYQGRQGITLPEFIYLYIQEKRDWTANLVLYMTTEDKFYTANFGELKVYADKYCPFFPDDFGENIVAIPKDLFIADDAITTTNDIGGDAKQSEEEIQRQNRFIRSLKWSK